MKAHVEIDFRIKHLPEGGLHEVLQQFTTETCQWHFPREKSQEYQLQNGRAAGFVVCNRSAAAVAIANLDKNRPLRFKVPNIVPTRNAQLTLDEYNSIGMAFAGDFRRWLRQS